MTIATYVICDKISFTNVLTIDNDDFHVFAYDDIYNDFYGSPGPFDERLLNIHSKDVVYLGSVFERAK